MCVCVCGRENEAGNCHMPHATSIKVCKWKHEFVTVVQQYLSCIGHEQGTEQRERESERGAKRREGHLDRVCTLTQ